jgi:hypothetical protein
MESTNEALKLIAQAIDELEGIDQNKIAVEIDDVINLLNAAVDKLAT